MSDGAGCGTTTRPSASEASSSFEFWSPEDTQRIRDQAKTMRAEARLPLPTDNAPPFPGWAYLRVGRGEKELTVMVRQHGARWIRQGQVWRLRADSELHENRQELKGIRFLAIRFAWALAKVR